MITTLQVPRVERDPSGGHVVTAWGQVAGMTLRAGDRLLLGQGGHDGLLLLEPRGLGRLMFGRWSGRNLVAEPGGVPASQRRWAPLGVVMAVERELCRGVLDGRTWAVAVRLGATDGTTCPAPAELSGGALTATGLDALCLRATVAASRDGTPIALAAASDLEAAESALDGTPAGFIRYVLPPRVAAPERGRLIVGPWASVRQRSMARAHRSPPGNEHDRVQLRLFGDSA